MYDEYERAMTGRSRSGMGLMGWIGVGLATSALVMVGVGVAGAIFVKHRMADFQEAWNASPAVTVADMLARLDPALESLDPAGANDVATLRDARSGETASFDFQDLVRGDLRIQDRDGRDVSVRLRGDENGGSLVVNADGERVSFDLVRQGDGAHLVIRSSDGDVVRLGAGDGAETVDVPAWLPRTGSMPSAPRPVFSARSGDGAAGAVTWKTSDDPRTIVASWSRELRDRGFEVVRQSASRNGRGDQASVWASDEDQGRSAFLVAAREDGETNVVAGFRIER